MDASKQERAPRDGRRRSGGVGPARRMFSKQWAQVLPTVLAIASESKGLGARKLSVLVLAASILVAALLYAFFARLPVPLETPPETPPGKPAVGLLAFEFYDFFNVPFGEWRDARAHVYNERPVGAECFNATAIANGICTPTRADVLDVASYPYTVWSSFPIEGRAAYSNPYNNPTINAPYRMRVRGTDVRGYDLSEPVFLPVLNSTQPAGNLLEFSWSAQFVDTATADDLEAKGCGVSGLGDGYYVRSQLVLTMDLQESRRMFDVQAADPPAAQAWWDSAVDLTCLGNGPAETGVLDWFVAMGGGPGGSQVGKYDIMNAYEWFLDQFYLDMRASVDADGTTHVAIDHGAWGTMNLLTRMFYWGKASYADHYLDSTKSAGWFGMEPYGWFEDFLFSGNLSETDVDFRLEAVVPYHLELRALPGPDGFLNRVGDIPAWRWGPHLHDYLNDFMAHPGSELDRYPGAMDLHATPGGVNYNRSLSRFYVPLAWDLRANETWHFQFPRGNVVFLDPNLTPIPANPVSNDHVRIVAPVAFHATKPASFGVWDPQAVTWDVAGPLATGGPAGQPGQDQVPGTADDAYAQEPWGAIYLSPAAGSAFTLGADVNGWIGEDGNRNPTRMADAGSIVTTRIDTVNSLHNWALYPGGTQPQDVAIGSENAIARSADVSSSSPAAVVRFESPTRERTPTSANSNRT